MPAIQMPVRASDAEAIVRELFELADIQIGGTRLVITEVDAPEPVLPRNST
jgi:hypothetical protein